jgi:metal-responsive CopG/Arc/MetJ family transcriptional regulator
MKSITVKLDNRLSERVAKLAKKRRLTKSEVVRQAIEAIPQESDATNSIVERFRHLLGTAKGLPKDLSSNKKYMRGFGE